MSATRRLPPRTPCLALAAMLCLLSACGCGEKAKPPKPKPKAAPDGRIQAAHVLAKKAMELAATVVARPDDNAARFALADLCYDAGRPELAAPVYEAALERQPDNPGARTDLGTCYKRMGKLDLAQAEYERVIEKHPSHIQAVYNLAVVSDMAGNYTRAADLWERVGAMAPGTPTARAALRHAAAARATAAAPVKPKTPEKEPPR